ncbi:MAG: DedA family protein [Gammaproteobacteria bacterium]|nr:DedA family protein [Gammaproteobacteria bacterium]
MFTRLYNFMMLWAQKPQAPWYLAGLSFAESSFFPIPPDVMLAPMCLAKPAAAWRYAFLTTIASVAGGLLGYVLGYFAFEMMQAIIVSAGYEAAYLHAKHWFSEWGFWAIFLAGFSPIPYKVFTITAGSLSMGLFPFVLASVIGRGLRFYLVAGLLVWKGERMAQLLPQYVERIGWGVIVLVVTLYFLIQWT